MARLDQPVEQSQDSQSGLDPELPPQQKALRDLFVSEYMIDFDAVAACMRCGYGRQFAREFAIKFMDESYVQQRITAIKYQKVEPRDELEFNQKRIKAALMFEAHYRGPGSSHAARVNALAKLAAMNGLDMPRKLEATVQHRGGVMAVPGISKLDDWEREASASQDQLVENARNT